MAGGAALKRGEIWWARLAPKTRPVVLVSREEAYGRRQFLIVAPISTRARGLPAEVRLGAAEGLPRASVANCDSLSTIDRRLLVDRVGAIAASRIQELDDALAFALGLE